MAQSVSAPRRRAVSAVARLDGLLAARVRRAVGLSLAEANGTVEFRAEPAGTWTLLLQDGRVNVVRGSVGTPTTVVRIQPEAFAAVLEGRLSGVQAFLDGRLLVRGNLALALQIDGAFDVGRRPDRFPRTRFVDAAGAHTFYLEAGPRTGRPLLLLHGLGATNASMLPLLPDLARRYRVLAPDMPGFGASEAPHWRYTFGELANWLQAFQKATDTMPAAIVGNSLGGRIAIESGLADPRTVTGLALLCPSPAFRRMRQFVPLVRLLSPDLSQLPMRFSHRFVRESIRFMFGEPDRLRPEWYDAAADEFRRIMRSPGHRRAFFASMREIYLEEAYGVNGFWDRLPRMTRPALFIWGGRDRLVPVGFERHVVCALPEARSVVLPACGHVPQYELPEQTLRLVRRFVDGLR